MHFIRFSFYFANYSLSLYRIIYYLLDCYFENKNNMIAFNISNPNEVALQIAARVKARRLELDLTQEGLAARAGVKFATYRRFEQTGEISLKGLLQVGFALNALHEFDALFTQRQYQTLDDVLNEQSVTRKRGRKK